MFKPHHLRVSSIFYTCLCYLGFEDLRRQGSHVTYLGPETAERLKAERFLVNAVWKLTEKEMDLKQNRREEEESPGAFSCAPVTATRTHSPADRGVSERPPSIVIRIMLNGFTVLYAPSSRDVCTHAHA